MESCRKAAPFGRYPGGGLAFVAVLFAPEGMDCSVAHCRGPGSSARLQSASCPSLDDKRPLQLLRSAWIELPK